MTTIPKPKSVQTVDSMREIFDDSQRVDKHNSCLKRLNGLQTIHSKTNRAIKVFYKELIRNLKFALYVPDSRSPFSQNTISFVIKYLLSFGRTTSSGGADVSTGGEDDDELRHEFIDAVLKDVVIPYTYSKKVDSRINSCHFIRLLSDELCDISDDIYDRIRKALLDRSADKISSVRAAAVLALHRFQDANDAKDLVIQAIHFHLNYDPDPEVRHNCLKAMAASQTSLKHFIGSTLDIKDFIRKTAYVQIADKLQIKCFTIEQRLTILKNGLKDRSSAVRKVVDSVLIPSWVKSCDNNLIQLLIALDIQTDIELIEKLLEIYFKHLNREKKVAEDLMTERTMFHELVDEFRDQYLAEERVFKVSMNVENVFLWRFLCEFCKTNRIESSGSLSSCQTTATVVEQTAGEDEETPETDVQIPVMSDDSPVNDESSENVDVFELLVPDVPIFCAYIEKFIQNVVISTELSIADALDFEFIFNQFLKVFLLLDIGDDAQRKILIKTMRAILIDNQIGDKFHKYITPIMKCLAKHGFKDKTSFLDFTAEIISEIFASIVSTSDENESMSDETNRELEEKKAKLSEDIDKCKTQLSLLEAEEKATEDRDVLTKKMKELEVELNILKESSLSQSSQTSHSRPLPSFSDYPKSLIRCLHIFSGCLEFGDYSEVNVVMQTHIEKVCLPGFLSDDVFVRCVATRCLGLVCLTSDQYFKKYLHLLIEIFMKDDQSIKIIALQSIFDSLCEHGINIFEEQCDKSGQKIIQLAFEDTDEDFITSLKQFFETQLDSEDNEIKQTAAQGVAKLLIHCRMYSPELLSKLIIIWFTPDENQVLVQFIGDFLRMYALAESQGVIIGLSAIEEAFLITLETIYNSGHTDINAENLIKYFVNLISDESHAKLALDLVKRVLAFDEGQSRLYEEFLLPAISHMNLIEMDDRDLKAFKADVLKVEEFYANSKSKNVKKKLVNILKNIDNRCQQLSADAALMDDFAPVDDDMPADSGQRSPGGSDSGAESFRTCPESPPKKRRKSSENDLMAKNTHLNESQVLDQLTTEEVIDETVPDVDSTPPDDPFMSVD